LHAPNQGTGDHCRVGPDLHEREEGPLRVGHAQPNSFGLVILCTLGAVWASQVLGWVKNLYIFANPWKGLSWSQSLCIEGTDYVWFRNKLKFLSSTVCTHGPFDGH
jgi:hypothetical protein